LRLITASMALALWLWPLWAGAQQVRLDAPDADSELRAVLRSASLTFDLRGNDTAMSQDYVAAARADYRRLLTALYGEGHYGGVISILVDGREAAGLDPLAFPGQVGEIVLRVTPGPRFTFGQTAIGPLAPGTELPESFAPGQDARADEVRLATRAAITGWRADGHALASPDGQQITARHPDQQLDVSVRIAPGPVLSYGTIGVTGAEAVRPERVQEIAGLRPGRRFDPEEIARAEANLRRIAAFRSAAIIEAEEAGPGDTLPLDIQVSEQTPRRIGAGAEFSSVTGLTLSGFWLHRNLLGGAERLRVTGGIDYRLGATYLRPATFRSDVDLYAEFALEQLDEPTFFKRQVIAEAGLIRRIREEAVVEVGIGFRAGEISDNLGDRDFQVLTFPIAGTRDRRDDPINPKSGYYARLEITPFLGLDSIGNGAQIAGDFRAYRSFAEGDRVTLAGRAQIGSVIGASAADVPPDLLFFSGGGGTVRGQPFQSLTAELGGNPIGGTAFFGLQAEARVNVTDTIGVVGFYDYGFIGSDALPFDNGDWHAGAGLGLRYDTGIGPIRLDLATPASGSDAGERLEIYIGIGQAF